MVFSLVTDMLSGAPCTLELQLDAEPNRKSAFLTKDRYVVGIRNPFSCFVERVRNHSSILMVKTFVELQV